MNGFTRIRTAVTGRLRRAKLRRAADSWLETATGTFVPPDYAWRAEELVGRSNRQMLAETLRCLESNATQRRWPGCIQPFPLPAVRANRTAVLGLAERLEQVSEAVTPAGMLRVEGLITDGASPLYGQTRSPELGDWIAATLRILDRPERRAA